jgi:hypothetical protein
MFVSMQEINILDDLEKNKNLLQLLINSVFIFNWDEICIMYESQLKYTPLLISINDTLMKPLHFKSRFVIFPSH